MLKDLDFVDEIALLSFKFNDLREKIGRFMEETARVGLKFNARKCKTLRSEFARNRENIAVNGKEVEEFERFKNI